MQNWFNCLGQSRVIAAVRNAGDIQQACKSKVPIVFLLTGDLLTINQYVERIRGCGKGVFLHTDFIAGLSNDPAGIKYLAQQVRPNGIISTKGHLVKAAKNEGLLTVQRLFLIDTNAMEQGVNNLRQINPDVVEVMPGLIPRAISELKEQLPIPIIAGGLIKNKAEIEVALRAGACAVSMCDQNLWNYQ
ncbi:glycerol-3-phosphate responsive antiterminator [Desulforamulus aquiferis]|uniref:Glycerol-3-phosphate responsive antiterminator n=1 Tax=Desulforamulus aquiferis TaxID=1397668 RepID=A0AAW7ZCT2_9FIRM|nr:glycerol-3-phosphate responsive antiterminator [Desulforamulus aquiferis]MDO7786600.1 glycerol-3-phosphate responsive antiterminator [Desulforamulus aquiferis]